MLYKNVSLKVLFPEPILKADFQSMLHETTFDNLVVNGRQQYVTRGEI